MFDLEVLRLAGEGVTVHHGEIPPGTPWWQAWSFDPWFLIPVGMLAWAYGIGLLRWERRTRDHPWWRTALFYTGLLVLVLSMESPVDRLAAHHFSMHMLQHELVMLWAVPLLLLGAPTTPVLRGMPRWLRIGVVRPLAGRRSMRLLYRVITHPVVAIVIFSVNLWLWHLAPGWYETAIADQKVHDVQHLSFVLTATLIWWNVIDPRPLHSRIPHLARVLYIFAVGVPKHVLAAMISLAPTPIYATYVEVRPVLALSPLEDQQLAGGIMWAVSMVITIIIMAIMFFVWMHVAQSRQRPGDIEGRRTATPLARRA